jgi:oligopeptide/dipeptide ABC transporter ATP-binding protein
LILEVERLGKHFPVGRGLALHAVEDVSFTLATGEALGIVGESGCGKTTLSRLLARLLDPGEGVIRFEGQDIGAASAASFARHPARAGIQMVFQDPTDSLNPRFTGFDAIAEPLRRLSGLSGTALAARVAASAELAGLPVELLSRYPHQLSGGQKARVGIARAIAPAPRLLILDEPTSALDVSVQAMVLQTLAALRARLGLAMIFVSHDLNVVRMMCDRVLVMYLGRVVEIGPAQTILSAPAHPYAQLLAASIPTGRPGEAVAIPPGETSSPINPPPDVCRFASRCPMVHERCRWEYPTPREVAPSHAAACHLAGAGGGPLPPSATS